MPIKVMHYYTYPENAGGPLTYIKNIVASEYFDGEVIFATCYQNKPASDITRADMTRIVGEIRAFSPDVLHVHGVQTEGFIGVRAGKRARVPKILMTVHGLQIDAQNINPIKRMIFRYFVEPYALRHSDAVYCVCDEMAHRPFIRRNARCLLPTLHNFITDRFLAGECTPIENIDEKTTVVATVGRVSYDKGMGELEQVILCDTHENVQFWIIGSGEYEATMREHLAGKVEEGKVVFFGQKQNVKDYISRADVFLFLSHHENLSIALLEAASMGACPIATAVGGNPEVVTDGKNGLLVPSMDSAAALRALACVLEDPAYREQLAHAAVDRVDQHFCERAFAERLIAIYKNLSITKLR